jgi:hypothetical protein
MTLTIELTPEQEARLTAAARQEGVSPADLASRLVVDHIPTLPVDRAADPTVALLQSWLAEDATDDPTEIDRAQAELDRFKAAINAERERAGARRAYP